MLKLTNESGGDCYVNIANVLSVHSGVRGETTILFPGNSYISVRESAEEVSRLVEVQRMQQASQDHWLHELAVAYDAPALSKDQRRVMANLMSKIQAKLEDTQPC